MKISVLFHGTGISQVIFQISGHLSILAGIIKKSGERRVFLKNDREVGRRGQNRETPAEIGRVGKSDTVVNLEIIRLIAFM